MQPLQSKRSKKLSFAIITILLSVSLWNLASASWIQGKAFIAQKLLNYSWQQSLNNTETNDKNNRHKPWPWADTWPVAKLMVPTLNINQIVLAGDSGNSLAFAPGYSLASAQPNSTGTTVISAHRDTHFKFLKKLKLNDQIQLETPDKKILYHVYDLKIVNSDNYLIQTDTDDKRLILVTCYPFGALTPGGPLRYLAFAEQTTNRDTRQLINN